jgi:hypothetical protein
MKIRVTIAMSLACGLLGCISPDEPEADQPEWLATLTAEHGEPMVVTPAGVLPARCVIEEGSTQAAETCGMEPIRVSASPRAAGIVPATDGWIEDGNAVWGSDMRKLSATWRVPAGPTRGVGQTIFLFPAMENLTGTMHILQPVLAWHDGWTLASWWGPDAKGSYHHTPGVSAATGDLIYGVIHGESCSTNCDWWVTAQNLSRGTTQTIRTSLTRSFRWTFGGVLEVYGATYCDTYPATNTTFDNIGVWDAVNVRHTPSSWSHTIDHDTGCGQGIGTDGNTVDLHY